MCSRNLFLSGTCSLPWHHHLPRLWPRVDLVYQWFILAQLVDTLAKLSGYKVGQSRGPFFLDTSLNPVFPKTMRPVNFITPSTFTSLTGVHTQRHGPYAWDGGLIFRLRTIAVGVQIGTDTFRSVKNIWSMAECQNGVARNILNPKNFGRTKRCNSLVRITITYQGSNPATALLIHNL